MNERPHDPEDSNDNDPPRFVYELHPGALGVFFCLSGALLAGLDCSTGSDTRRTEPSPPAAARASDNPSQPLSRSKPLMGTTFHIQVHSNDHEAAARAMAAAFDEVERIESLISSWQSTSELSKVNRMAGERPVSVGPELFELVDEAVRISRETDGAFDITFASCGSLWSFRDPQIPSEDELDECLGTIGYEQIELHSEESSLYLPHDDLRIGVGGIGKGYGVDRAAEELEADGVESYLVDGGGDVRVQAAPSRRRWKIGIAHPRKANRLLGNLHVRTGAVVTSGDYERSFHREGKRYHHILNPRTARPARKSIAVTVWAGDASRADALSTALFVLGPDDGLELATELSNVETLIVDPALELHMTDRFEDRFARIQSPIAEQP